MREKLELKIVVALFAMLLAGVIAASFSSLYVERENMFDAARERIGSTARVVVKSVERSMAEANADFTRNLVDEIKEVSGFELNIYNRSRREAFVFKSDPMQHEDGPLITAIERGEESIVRMDRSLVAYIPLPNLPKCQECHFGEGHVIGAVKVTVSLNRELEKMAQFGVFMVIGSVFAVLMVGAVLWVLMRRYVIVPIKELEKAAQRMSEGDLSFATEIESTDEMGRLDHSIKDSLFSLSGIIRRVKDVTAHISEVSAVVGRESDKVVDGTILEAEAIAEISSSIEELNAAISEVAESTSGLARSVQETAVSIEEMTNTIASIKEISHEVSEGVDTTSASIQELSATIREVSDNAADLARVSDETLAAVEEITTSVKQVEGKAKESASLSHKVTEDASSLGVTAINETLQGMERIRDSVSHAAGVVERLGGRSEEIGNILDVIDDITDQTTLLALNAAILAAQAGEHGKGFSVVANEIKDLAERTAISTHEIDSLIKNVREELAEAGRTMGAGMKAVDEGISLSKGASRALSKILDSSRRSSEMSSSIERTTAEQATTAKYVTEAIERVRAMVKDVAKATAEQAKGVALIMETTERIREASHRAYSATEQQAVGSRQISEAVESISEVSQQISRAINEQKSGSRQIWNSVEKIKDIPDRNRDLAFSINKALRELNRDSDLVHMEMQRFRLYEEIGRGVAGFGIVPFDSPASLYTKFIPLLDYLSKATGSRFEIKVATDYKGAVADLGSGAAKVSLMNALTYLDAKERFGAECMGQLLRNGKPTHRGAIFTRQHSTVRGLDDLRNRSMAFVDRNSASGFIVPKAMMERSGVKLDDLSYHNFLGFHEDVVRAVLKGDFETGAVMESVLDRFKDDGVRVLAVSDEIPEFVVCAGPSLDAAAREVLSKALTALVHGDSRSKAVLGPIDPGYTGVGRVSETDIAAILALVKA